MKDKDKKVHIRLSEDVHKKLRVKCAYDDTSVQDYVERLIRESVAGYSAEDALHKAGLRGTGKES
ncbi:MAG: hypothetical protein HYY01_01265 [Chloroflexi bacterium]|nr:hypothetical protein [Chloroflexota bacterium]